MELGSNEKLLNLKKRKNSSMKIFLAKNKKKNHITF